jgi:hypothetical protein
VYTFGDKRTDRKGVAVMTLDEIKSNFPVLGARFPENIFTSRELVIVDDNYVDEDGEETAEFEPSEYNYMLYIAEPMQEIIGEKGLSLLAKKIESSETFTASLAAEEDFFGLLTELNEEQISSEIFGMLEEIVS